MPNLSNSTVVDLALLVVVIADTAWDGAKKTLARLRPYIDPPADVEVRSTTGALYSGVLLIDKNEIIAGIVVRTGHRPAPAEPSALRSSSLTSSWAARSPLVTPSSRSRFDDHEDDDCKLPSWAEDSRETEDDRWRR